MTDPSNGYESISAEWLARRGNPATSSMAIGAGEVRKWAKTLPRGGSVIDMGCGPGLPLAVLLAEEGLQVFGVDASPTFVAAFRQNLPGTPVACESVLDSRLFDRTFDAVLSVGLMFLLKEEDQHRLMQRFSDALVPGGHLLFTATVEPHVWTDIITGKESISLGAAEYKRLLSSVGIHIVSQFEDEGENHYFEGRKADPSL